MPESFDRLDLMFPVLDDTQIARLSAFGERRQIMPGDVLYDQGDAEHGVFVVLEGSIEIVNVSSSPEALIRVLGRGAFTGEVNQISGRRSLVRCDAREAGEVLEIGRSKLQHVMQTDAALGELFLTP